MIEKFKNVAIVLGLIGGLMSMGGVIGGFVSVVRHWDHFVYMSEVINANDVRHYHEVIKPRVDKLWLDKNKIGISHIEPISHAQDGVDCSDPSLRCMSRAAQFHFMKACHSEVPFSVSKISSSITNGHPAIMEMFKTEDNTKWTEFRVDVDGQSCPVKHGSHWYEQ